MMNIVSASNCCAPYHFFLFFCIYYLRVQQFLPELSYDYTQKQFAHDFITFNNWLTASKNQKQVRNDL